MQPPPQQAGGTADELRADARQVSSSASNRIHKELDARKGTAANQARSVSNAVDKAAGELDDSSPEWLRSAFQQGAQQIQRFADTLEQKDSREILDDVRTFARDKPGTFLAGCAALGFAAARVFKAGGNEATEGQQRQTQFPPAQPEEPMFRRQGAEPAGSTTSAGEFA